MGLWPQADGRRIEPFLIAPSVDMDKAMLRDTAREPSFFFAQKREAYLSIKWRAERFLAKKLWRASRVVHVPIEAQRCKTN
jgi:hypothetical protein